MAGIRMFEEQLQIMSPHTLNALQKLVMAMADLAKNSGKKHFLVVTKVKRLTQNSYRH